MATNIYKSNERCYLAKDNVNMQVEFFFNFGFLMNVLNKYKIKVQERGGIRRETFWAN